MHSCVEEIHSNDFEYYSRLIFGTKQHTFADHTGGSTREAAGNASGKGAGKCWEALSKTESCRIQNEVSHHSFTFDLKKRDFEIVDSSLKDTIMVPSYSSKANSPNKQPPSIGKPKLSYYLDGLFREPAVATSPSAMPDPSVSHGAQNGYGVFLHQCGSESQLKPRRRLVGFTSTFNSTVLTLQITSLRVIPTVTSY